MDTLTLKIPEMQTEIIRRVLNLDAVKLSDLLSYMSVMDFYDDDDTEIEGFRFSDKPQSREEIIADLNDAVDDVRRGNFITFDELMKQTDEKIANYECCLV
ncbi:MAG: hypothetical protein II956_11615 [Bacteroidales bacterium]|nr:hypothetical protein [Bacteroidales bacterium]